MDRLVSADVKELELLYRPSHRTTAPFTITNLMHTMSVAISLTTTTKSASAGDANSTSAHLFTFSPAALFILPPLSSAAFSLVLAPTPSLPISAPDTLLLRSTMLPTGRASPDALRRIFSSPGRHVFRDASLPVSLVGPHVVRSLLLSGCASPGTLETAFHLSRAISGCSPPDLAALLVDAARAGNPKFVAAILDAGADPNSADGVGNSAIAAAVESGHVEVAKALIAAGAKPDGGLLLLAAESAADDEGVNLLTALAESGADVNSADAESGRSAVHEFASRGLAEAVRVLVARGADPAVADASGWTPLHCAAAGNHLAAAELLLSAAPCTKYVVTRDGKPPFALADDENGELMDLLRLGDCLHRAASAGDASGVRSCVGRGASVDGRDQNGWTALHRAAWKGWLEVVKVLVGAGAQIDAVDDAGYTPLHCAVEAGQGNVALYLEAHGARVNHKTVKSLCGRELRRVQLRGEEKGVVHS